MSTPEIDAAMAKLYAADAEGNGQAVDLGRVDLGPIVYGDTNPLEPGLLYRPDGKGLIYPGATHGLHGEPGHGKTWFICLAVAEVLRTGKGVLMLDYEGSPHSFVKRLEQLGVSPEIIADPKRLAYHNIPGATDDRHVAGLADEVDDLGAALLALDAMLPALARNGMNDNDNSDVAMFFESMAHPLARLGAAVILLDHLAKDSAGRARGARGAGAKLQLVDVSYSLAVTDSFSKIKAGAFTITCDKDRFGTYGIGEKVALVKVTPGKDGAVTLTVENPPAGSGWSGPTHLMAEVSKYLEIEKLKSIDPPSTKQVSENVKGRKQWILEALKELEKAGCVKSEQAGTAIRWRLIESYREGDEPTV